MRLAPDPETPGKLKLAFDLLDGTGVKTFPTSRKSKIVRPCPGVAIASRMLYCHPVRSIVFPVYKEHLQKSRSIYVPFNYGLGKMSSRTILDLEHRCVHSGDIAWKKYRRNESNSAIRSAYTKRPLFTWHRASRHCLCFGPTTDGP